jgi:hypothetical protein
MNEFSVKPVMIPNSHKTSSTAVANRSISTSFCNREILSDYKWIQETVSCDSHHLVFLIIEIIE